VPVRLFFCLFWTGVALKRSVESVFRLRLVGFRSGSVFGCLVLRSASQRVFPKKGSFLTTL
jgi:hypothetical protein